MVNKFKNHSWEMIDNTAIKNLDYSAFNHSTSVIPKEMYSFFNLTEDPMKKKEVSLILTKSDLQEQKIFNASIRHVDKSRSTPVKMIRWNKDLQLFLKSQFKNWDDITQGDKSRLYKLNFYKTKSDEIFNIEIQKLTGSSLPKLKKAKRSTEFNRSTEEEISTVIKSWLFSQKSFRSLDEEIFKLDSRSTKGFHSMSICHYLGLNDDFKGIFEGLEIVEAIELLKQGSKEFEKIIIYLELESKKNILRLPDSYVYPQNKKGSGSGESTPYIGNQNYETFNYWGNLNEVIEVQISRKNLIEYYFMAKTEFMFPSQSYRNTNKMKATFNDLYDDIQALDKNFNIKYLIYSGDEDSTRAYLKTVDESSTKVNNIFRKLSLHPFTIFEFLKINKNLFAMNIIFDRVFSETDPKDSDNESEIKINSLPAVTDRKIFSYVTNPELVKQIKSKYTKCQFCNYVFESYINSNNEIKQYSEAAHIKPKSEGGLDNLNNILCLCANCHSLFDLGTLYIDDNFVVRKSEKLLNLSRYEDSYFNELELNEDHELELSNIKFHRKLTKNN